MPMFYVTKWIVFDDIFILGNALGNKNMAEYIERTEDERLSEAVRQYPALYNKKCIEFKYKNIKKNCLKIFSEKLGLESVIFLKYLSAAAFLLNVS